MASIFDTLANFLQGAAGGAERGHNLVEGVLQRKMQENELAGRKDYMTRTLAKQSEQLTEETRKNKRQEELENARNNLMKAQYDLENAKRTDADAEKIKDYESKMRVAEERYAQLYTRLERAISEDGRKNKSIEYDDIELMDIVNYAKTKGLDIGRFEVRQVINQGEDPYEYVNKLIAEKNKSQPIKTQQQYKPYTGQGHIGGMYDIWSKKGTSSPKSIIPDIGLPKDTRSINEIFESIRPNPEPSINTRFNLLRMKNKIPNIPEPKEQSINEIFESIINKGRIPSTNTVFELLKLKNQSNNRR